MAYNKVKYGSKTLIDLTGDTVTPEKLLLGTKAHDKSGKNITGTFLQGYPEIIDIDDGFIQDSNGSFIITSSSEKINSHIIYGKK